MYGPFVVTVAVAAICSHLPAGAGHSHNFHDIGYAKEGAVIQELRTLGVLSPMPFDSLDAEKVRAMMWRGALSP